MNYNDIEYMNHNVNLPFFVLRIDYNNDDKFNIINLKDLFDFQVDVDSNQITHTLDNYILRTIKSNHYVKIRLTYNNNSSCSFEVDMVEKDIIINKYIKYIKRISEPYDDKSEKV